MTGKEKYDVYYKWCIEHHLPPFVPEDNSCPICGKPIFRDGDEGPSPAEYPTGCNNCHRSFCD